MGHTFVGKWITNSEFCELKPRNVFHRQLETAVLPCDEHRNRHILFRKKFNCPPLSGNSKIYISADDYYKLYINGHLAAQGPTPSYHFQYNYNTVDVSKYLKAGENVIAVHTLYQGLINRVWQSGDNRHGLILDLLTDGQLILASDESFKTSLHSSYTETGTCGYDTQFLERYDSTAAEIGFEKSDFDDTCWENAKISKYCDHTLVEQTSRMPELEKIYPLRTVACSNRILYDFGSNYAGYLNVTAVGKEGTVVTVRCAQELNDDGSVRFNLRANCKYEEEWILSDGESTLDWFDYKSFRYAELLLSSDVEIKEVFLTAKHYPFKLRAKLSEAFSHDESLKKYGICVYILKNTAFKRLSRIVWSGRKVFTLATAVIPP